MAQVEVEIKSLLGDEAHAEALRQKMKELDPETKLLSTHTQLNHYFQGGNLQALAETLRHNCLSDEKCIELGDIAKRAKDFSVRTRQADDAVLLVVKASVDDTTSANGISRIEFEEKVNIPLGAVDALILGSGFTYQAKWSRKREEYAYKGITVCLDNNAGYGWLAEFEKMVATKEDAPAAHEILQSSMKELGVAELPQDRLARMFDFYNAHWEEYYGTDKTFTVK